jgi:ElaB/YqjD/DUF883 family membrane-anchored ribosome-binding protein
MSEKNSNNVDQIRELIFGSQLKEFDEKFVQLHRIVSTMEETLSTSIQTSYTKLHKEISRTLEALEEKMDNLTTTNQKERLKLKELIDATDESLQDQLNNQKNEWLAKLKITKENMDDENQKLNNDMQALKAEVQATVQTGLSALSDEKLSRDAMAQMLLDMAMQIQGSDMQTLLTAEQTTEK